jgi:O-methyltransferase
MSYAANRISLISPDNLATLLAYAAATPPGDFVELGVYRGGSARELYRVAEAQGRTLFLYDTFTGHPAPSEHDDPAHPAGRFADCADPAALAREMPNARITVARFGILSDVPARIAFAHVDVDLYPSTRAAIVALTPSMVRGGIMYFDDYGVPDCPGATKAADELLGDTLERLPNGKALWTCP